MHQEHPELIKDQYWDEIEFEVPYTAAAEHFRITAPHIGSAMDIRFVLWLVLKTNENAQMRQRQNTEEIIWKFFFTSRVTNTASCQ